MKWIKNSKWGQKGLKFYYVALNVACWMQKKSWVEISLLKWNAFETHELSSETLVLWKRWSSLYTKCIHFFAVPSQILNTCYVSQMTIPCQVPTFSEFSCSAFQLQGHLAQNKSLNDWKNANEVRKYWHFSMWLWMLHV